MFLFSLYLEENVVSVIFQMLSSQQLSLSFVHRLSSASMSRPILCENPQTVNSEIMCQRLSFFSFSSSDRRPNNWKTTASDHGNQNTYTYNTYKYRHFNVWSPNHMRNLVWVGVEISSKNNQLQIQRWRWAAHVNRQ